MKLIYHGSKLACILDLGVLLTADIRWEGGDIMRDMTEAEQMKLIKNRMDAATLRRMNEIALKAGLIDESTKHRIEKRIVADYLLQQEIN